MNERIKELRNQALLAVDNELETVGSDHAVMYREHLDMVNEKFAELIIRECIDVCCSIDEGHVSSEIYEHFGIKA